MPERGLGYCGFRCELRPVFVATAKNDDALRRQTAEQWSTLYGEYLGAHPGRRQLEPQEMSHSGCWSTNVFVGCSICAIRACATRDALYEIRTSHART